MAANKDIWTFSEKIELSSELIAGARSLKSSVGGTVTSIVLGSKDDAETAIMSGADRVLWLGNPADQLMIEDYIPTLIKLIQTETPFGLLVGATKRGKVVAGRLGAAFGASVITDVRKFVPHGKELQLGHMIFGGGALRFETNTSDLMLATINPGLFESSVPDPYRNGEIIEVDFIEPEWRLILHKRKAKPSSSIDITSAKKIVCAGVGVAKKEDLVLIQDLATALSAEIGCTRTLSEGRGWLPRERYIGISGVFIKPDVYFGIGVSGQVQHTIGIGDSKIIVVINKDKNAPAFEQADYGIIGDLYEIVPALTEEIKSRSQTAQTSNNTD